MTRIRIDGVPLCELTRARCSCVHASLDLAVKAASDALGSLDDRMVFAGPVTADDIEDCGCAVLEAN